jgi:hypothetical protein
MLISSFVMKSSYESITFYADVCAGYIDHRLAFAYPNPGWGVYLQEPAQ